ncbi:expressed unknown protein [Seminavis robusta]|uniref:Uncharacterized protein n=1 Tax=Seminavis robusta TaxID=568900 RepID=A0A9N8H3P2_9STRA|nr:expressed unknown protein [Seminavis robusta]|eukprot:Sro43_g026140.1 n/a (309) ;mRNA; f:63608-64534
MGCMTDLDTTEVIMNNQVVASEDSDHPNVHLEIVQQQGAMVELKLIVPEELQDVQFVVDILYPEEDVVVVKAKLVHGQCDHDKRVAARSGDTVTLQFWSDDQCVSVVAGWATGHEAVRLTPVLQVCPQAGEQQQEQQIIKDELKEQAAAYKEDLDRVVANDKKEHPHDDKDHDFSKSDHRREDHHHHHHHHHRDHAKDDDGDKDARQVQEEKNSRERPEDKSDKARARQRIKERQRALMQEKEKLEVQQHKNDDKSRPIEQGIDLDTTWFLYGLAILLVGHLLVVQGCRVVAAGGDYSSLNGKGRRTH